MTGFKPGDRVHMRAHDHTPATIGTVAGTTAEGRILVLWDDGPVTTSHFPQHLEPLGEPMNTFPSAASSSDRTLVIDGSGDEGVLKIMRGDYYIGGINLEPAQAPATALAILEAAGVQLYRDPKAMAPTLSSIACDLEELVVQLQIDAKEAAGREALEGEALELCRVLWDNPAQAWAPMSDKAKETWLGLARKARELHGVTA